MALKKRCQLSDVPFCVFQGSNLEKVWTIGEARPHLHNVGTRRGNRCRTGQAYGWQNAGCGENSPKIAQDGSVGKSAFDVQGNAFEFRSDDGEFACPDRFANIYLVCIPKTPPVWLTRHDFYDKKGNVL